MKRKASRGAAAMEFAFVAPLLILLLSGIVMLGLALVAKYRIYGVTSAAVRNCVASQNTGTTESFLQACATAQFATLVTSLGTGCDSAVADAPVVSRIDLPKSGLSSASTRLVSLQLSATCSVAVNPLSGFTGGLVPANLTFKVTSAMPFVIGQ